MSKKTPLRQNVALTKKVELPSSKNNFGNIDEIAKKINTSNENPVVDLKTITFKVDSDVHKNLKLAMVNRGQSIKKYITNLIKKDLGLN